MTQITIEGVNLSATESLTVSIVIIVSKQLQNTSYRKRIYYRRRVRALQRYLTGAENVFDVW
jgi:hypothetical protein